MKEKMVINFSWVCQNGNFGGTWSTSLILMVRGGEGHFSLKEGHKQRLDGI